MLTALAADAWQCQQWAVTQKEKIPSHEQGPAHIRRMTPRTPHMTLGSFTSFSSCSNTEVVGHEFSMEACSLPGFRSGDDLSQSLFSK